MPLKLWSVLSSLSIIQSSLEPTSRTCRVTCRSRCDQSHLCSQAQTNTSSKVWSNLQILSLLSIPAQVLLKLSLLKVLQLCQSLTLRLASWRILICSALTWPRNNWTPLHLLFQHSSSFPPGFPSIFYLFSLFTPVKNSNIPAYLFIIIVFQIQTCSLAIFQLYRGGNTFPAHNIPRWKDFIAASQISTLISFFQLS